MPRLHQSLLVITLIALALLILRYMGERRFAPVPQALPSVSINTDTPIYHAVQQELQDSTADMSLFVPLGNAHLALMGRIQLAESAQQTLNIQYYLFHDDDAGQAMLAALVEAAERGVKVRLLLDDMDTAGREGLLIRLAANYPNLTIRIFNPVYTRSFRPLDFIARFPRSSRRMHNKSFTADGIASIVGGRNIGNEYFEVDSEVAFLDLDVLAAGPVAAEVTQAFNRYWYSGIAFNINTLGDAAEDTDYQAWRDQLQASLQAYRDELQKLGPLPVQRLMKNELRAYTGPSEVIYDAPEKVISTLFASGDWLAPHIVKLLASARQELIIVSPYFIPGKNGVQLMKSLADKGVAVTILTNSYSANDVVVVHSGYIDYRRALLEAGVQLYELKSSNPEQQTFSLFGSRRSSLHAKTFLIDQQRSFVGSFNLDPRSAIHNTEMGVVFDNSDYGQTAHQYIMEQLAERAYQVTLSETGRMQWIEHRQVNSEMIRETHATEPGTTLLQRGLIYLISWLPVEWLL